jgi:4-alpha-glucanotransferase
MLLHPTSLPGLLGGGDFGPDAYRFVDWLQSAGQRYWQVLPLGEVGPGNSPYMSCSAFAGNILLIDLNEIASHGWLQRGTVEPLPQFRSNRIDFSLLRPFRMGHLRRAARNFFSSPHDDLHRSFTEFCMAEAQWLDDYALFMTICEREGQRHWNLWPEPLARREVKALRMIEEIDADEVAFWKFCQWCFDRQWSRLRLYASERGVKVIGDVPIFVAYESADVWSHQDLFKLDEEGNPLVVAGVPPDYFSSTGQLWGNPLYRWDVHEGNGFAWWIARLGHALKQADLVRIDHFRGFAAYWEIPADAPNAVEGQWVQGPGEKLFAAFKAAFPNLPVIAEDLGIITPDVTELRDKFNLPGMRVLQFAFGDGEQNPFLPHNYVPNSVAYTGTHDNDTILGWWKNLPEHEKSFARHYLKTDGENIQWDMMRAISDSSANLVIVTMQDVLGLDGNHRMNQPGQHGGSWEWRFSWGQVQPWQAEALARLTSEYDRRSH